MKWIPLFVALALACSGDAWAQTYGNQAYAQVNPGLSVSTLPNANNVTQTSVTCANTSTAFGVTGSLYLAVQIPPTATQSVCFGWGATVATTSTPSECFTAGTVIQWGGGSGTCIVATGTQTISVITK